MKTTEPTLHAERLIAVLKFLMQGIVGWLALGLVFPAVLPNATVPVSMLGIDTVLLILAVQDLRTRCVPNILTYPIMAAGLARAAVLVDFSFVVFWAVLWLLWAAHIFAGGDAKLLMGLFALFPDMRLVWIVSLSVLATGLPYLAYKHWRTLTSAAALGKALRSVGWRIFTGQVLPSQDKLDEEGRPFVFAFSLAGAAFLLLREWHP